MVIFEWHFTNCRQCLLKQEPVLTQGWMLLCVLMAQGEELLTGSAEFHRVEDALRDGECDPDPCMCCIVLDLRTDSVFGLVIGGNLDERHLFLWGIESCPCDIVHLWRSEDSVSCHKSKAAENSHPIQCG